MTRAVLRQDIKEYLHRENDVKFTNARLDTFINKATQRLGRDLDSRRNATQTTLAVTAGVATLPDNVTYIQSVFNDDCELPATTKANTSNFGTGTTPLAYAVFGTKLYVYPAATVTLTVQYFITTALGTGDTATNGVLTAFPQLYLWAALAEAAIYTQDQPLITLYTDLYNEEVARQQLRDRDRRAPHTFGRFFLQRRGVRGT